jgi:uncharacterized protein with FMN-binding domain
VGKKLLVIAGLSIAVFVLFFGITFYRFSARLRATTIENIPVEYIADGEYSAGYDLFLVSAEVTVDMRNGRIEDISLREHDHGPGYSGEKVIDRIIQQQSVAVDGVSGATGSSVAIQKAIELALSKGRMPEPQRISGDSSTVDTTAAEEK